MTGYKFPKVAMAIAILIVLSGAVCGQTSLGGVNGTVTDSTGAGAPDATVRLLNQATNIDTRAQTNAHGYSTFVNVRPGDYRLSVEVRGFPLTRIDQPNPGRITSVSHPPRQMQFGLRVVLSSALS